MLGVSHVFLGRLGQNNSVARGTVAKTIYDWYLCVSDNFLVSRCLIDAVRYLCFRCSKRLALLVLS